MECLYIIRAECLLCLRAKLRGSPKALITKLLRETLIVASIMPEGIVISLEMIGIYY